jgi:hypothetical protein
MKAREAARIEFGAHWYHLPVRSAQQKDGLEQCCRQWGALQERQPLHLLALFKHLGNSPNFLDSSGVSHDLPPPRRSLLVGFSQHSLAASIGSRRRTTSLNYLTGTTRHTAYVATLEAVANAIIYRFVPLLYLFPFLEPALSDFTPLSSDILSSSSTFALQALGYAQPSSVDLIPIPPSGIVDDPSFRVFISSYTDLLQSAQSSGEAEEKTVDRFQRMCTFVEADAEAGKLEEKLFEAILEAVLQRAEEKKDKARRKN